MKPGQPLETGPGTEKLAVILRRITEDRNAEAARRLADAWSGRLYGLAYRILSDRQAAEDVIQDVFVALLQGKARYRGPGDPEVFLLRVTSFLALKRAQTRQRQGQREEGAAMLRSKVVSGALPALDVALRKELETEVAALLRTLGPETRAAVVLRFWHGATVRQIAKILSSRRSTVQRWIEGALATLRQPLLRKGFGAALALSLLGDLLRSMEAPQPSAPFAQALANAIDAAPT